MTPSMNRVGLLSDFVGIICRQPLVCRQRPVTAGVTTSSLASNFCSSARFVFERRGQLSNDTR